MEKNPAPPQMYKNHVKKGEQKLPTSTGEFTGFPAINSESTSFHRVKIHAWVVQVEAVAKEQPSVTQEKRPTFKKNSLDALRSSYVSPGLSF